MKKLKAVLVGLFVFGVLFTLTTESIANNQGGCERIETFIVEECEGVTSISHIDDGLNCAEHWVDGILIQRICKN